jgi:DNA-binding LacI/PurR family transcriptional regulator
MSASDGRGPLQVERRAQLLDELQRQGTVRVSDLTERLGVAAVTIRRDIAQLAAEGLVRRVHGGVTVILPDEAGEEVAYTTTGAAGVGPRTIGMLVPSLDYYWPGVVRGAEEAAREYGHKVVLRGSSYESEDDRPQLERLVDGLGAEGLAIAPRLDTPTIDATLEWLAATGVPTVLVERDATVGPHHAVLESVTTDHALGAAIGTRHLLSLGHRRVGAVLSKGSPTSRHIQRGWHDAITEAGFAPADTVEVLLPGLRSAEWDKALDETLDRCLSTGTTALLVHADAEAMALVQRCEERHLSVPGDLSVVAYDDEVAGLFSPPLTAVRPPRRSIGRAAVDLVVARFADPGRPTHRVVISPSLRVRESTAPPKP